MAQKSLVSVSVTELTTYHAYNMIMIAHHLKIINQIIEPWCFYYHGFIKPF